MPDIEKIKKGLEECGSDNYNLDKGCDTCPYYDFSPHHDYDFDFGCIKVLARDTLELLRKLQDIELYIKDCEREIDTGKNDIEKTYYKGVHYGLLIAKELINGIRSHG